MAWKLFFQILKLKVRIFLQYDTDTFGGDKSKVFPSYSSILQRFA